MKNRIELGLRVWRGDDIAIGPGKAELLEAIAASGSISGAARAMDMSYRRAWLLVDTMNRCFREPLVITAAGGSKGGGASLTEAGKTVLAHYRKMRRAAEAAMQADLDKLAGMLAPE